MVYDRYMSEEISQCPQCQMILVPHTNFCPNCGFHIVQQPQILSVGKQIWIYFVSLLLPPLGLIWTFKYFRSESQQLKRIAIIALTLTVVSVILTLWFTVGFFQSLQSQLSTYQNLGL